MVLSTYNCLDTSILVLCIGCWSHDDLRINACASVLSCADIWWPVEWGWLRSWLLLLQVGLRMPFQWCTQRYVPLTTVVHTIEKGWKIAIKCLRLRIKEKLLNSFKYFTEALKLNIAWHDSFKTVEDTNYYCTNFPKFLKIPSPIFIIRI